MSLPDKYKEPQFVVVVLIILMTAALDWGCIWIVCSKTLTNEAYGLMMGVLSIWHLGFAAGYGYYLGTTSQSKDKDSTIANLSK